MACDKAGRPYHPDTLSKRWSKLVRAAGVRHINPALGAAHLRHHAAPSRRSLVCRRGMARTCGCERDGKDLRALPAGCAHGGLGDIGSSCDKHCDTRQPDGRNELGSDPLRSRAEPRHVSAPEGIRTPNLLIRSQMLYPLSYGRMSSIVALTLVSSGGGERI